MLLGSADVLVPSSADFHVFQIKHYFSYKRSSKAMRSLVLAVLQPT